MIKVKIILIILFILFLFMPAVKSIKSLGICLINSMNANCDYNVNDDIVLTVDDNQNIYIYKINKYIPKENDCIEIQWEIKNGEKVQLKPTDFDFIDNINSFILNNNLCNVKLSKNSISTFIALSFLVQLKSYKIVTYFKDRCSQISFLTKTKDKRTGSNDFGTCMMATNNYEYLEWVFEEGKYKLNQYNAINPDIIDLEDYPVIDIVLSNNEDINTNSSKIWTDEFKGFIDVRKDKKDAFVAGKKMTLPQEYELINDRAAIPLDWFADSLNCKALFNNQKVSVKWKEFDLYDERPEVNIEINIGELNYLFNGKKKFFPFKPYIKNDIVMVPLRAFAEEIGVKVYWRESDKSILITRWPIVKEKI